MTAKAFIHGAAVEASWGDARRNLMELIFDTVSAALADAGCSMAQVDSVVLAAHDLVDGRSLSSMVTAPAAGAYLRDEIRLSEDGLAALSLGAARIESAESELTVVAAWGRASEGGFGLMSSHSMDPFAEQPLGLSDATISAFRLSAWLSAHGPPEGRTAAATARAARAAKNPRALAGSGGAFAVDRPLRAEEGPKLADMVAAMVVGRAPGKVRLAGFGHGTDTPQLGARAFGTMPALAAAARQAFGAARINPDRMDVVELDGLTLVDEAIALESAGFAAPGRGFDVYADRETINGSGGGAAGWCYPAMGLVRTAETYFRLRSRGGPGAGFAAGFGAVGAQTATAVVLEAS